MRIKGTLLVIFSLDIIGLSSADVCYAGRGIGPAVNAHQWAVAVGDPCRCGAVRLGGQNAPAAPAFSTLFPGGHLLLSEDAGEIWTFFNCTARFCAAMPGSNSWRPFNRSCYLIIKDLVKHSEAEERCVHLPTPGESAHLASIHSADENAFLQRYYAAEYRSSGNIALWIGYQRVGYGQSTTYQWTDGSVGDFEDWNAGEPTGGTERCTVLWYGEHWNDWDCAFQTAPFVCKVPPY